MVARDGQVSLMPARPLVGPSPTTAPCVGGGKGLGGSLGAPSGASQSPALLVLALWFFLGVSGVSASRRPEGQEGPAPGAGASPVSVAQELGRGGADSGVEAAIGGIAVEWRAVGELPPRLRAQVDAVVDSIEAGLTGLPREGSARRGRDRPGEQEWARAVVEVCVSAGYGEARARVLDGAGIELDVGPLSKLGAIRLFGAPANLADDLRFRLETLSGGRFETDVIVAELEWAAAALRERGHLFAALEPRVRRSAGGRLGLDVWVREGPEVRVEAVHVRGARRTSDETIRRAMGLAIADLAAPSALRDAAERLERLGYFSAIQGPRFVRGHGERGVGIEVGVEEARNRRAEGILGYRSRGGETVLTGSVDLALHNLFGSGRELDLRWLRPRSDETRLEVHWLERWLFGTDLSVGVGFRQYIEDSTYVDDQVSLDMRYPLSAAWEGSLEFGRRRIVPGSRRVGETPPASLTRSVTVAVGLFALDSALDPRRGARGQGSVELGRRDHESQVSGRGGVEGFWPLGLRGGLRLATNLGGIAGPRERPDLIPVGGVGTIRGYDQGVFRTSHYLLGSLEWRWRTGPGSHVSLFADGGVVGLDGGSSGDLLLDAFQWHRVFGYGLGLSIPSRLGMVGLDYGIARGESLASGRLHIGMTTDF